MASKFVNLFLKFSFGGLVSAVISFFSTPVITALIMPAEFGKASMFILAFNLLLQIILLGVDQSFVRYFYQDKFKSNSGALLASTITAPVVFALLAMVGLLLFWRPISIALVDTPNFTFALLLAFTLLIGVVERFSTLLIRMMQDAVLFSNLKIIQVITNFAVIVLFAHFVERSFFAIIYGNILSLLFISLVGIYAKRRIWLQWFKADKQTIIKALKYGLPFVPVFVIAWIFEGIDKMALKYYSNFSEIGIYTAASKIVAVLMILQTTFSNFWIPIAYEAFENNSAESRKLFESVYSKLSVLFFIVSLLIMLAKDLIICLFNKNYSEAINVVPFLIFMPVMYSLSEITVSGINFVKKTQWHLAISALSTLVNFICVVILVPKYGAKGAAISTAIGYIVFFYTRTFISNYYFPLNFRLKRTTISIVLLFAVAFVNIICNKTTVFFINLTALVAIVLLYFRELSSVYSSYIKKGLA
ncbi:lipopolysaccharide biosynthesis protein [Mucilaginibacter panaciglaebae]|uniref:lipopolysaccharide biosynthesis protein n=1 Tax=Mucilaginibacter panaciglaebae TaxID=502331 RepID=UPI0031F02691